MSPLRSVSTSPTSSTPSHRPTNRAPDARRARASCRDRCRRYAAPRTAQGKDRRWRTAATRPRCCRAPTPGFTVVQQLVENGAGRLGTGVPGSHPVPPHLTREMKHPGGRHRYLQPAGSERRAKRRRVGIGAGCGFGSDDKASTNTSNRSTARARRIAATTFSSTGTRNTVPRGSTSCSVSGADGRWCGFRWGQRVIVPSQPLTMVAVAAPNLTRARSRCRATRRGRSTAHASPHHDVTITNGRSPWWKP